MMPQSARILTTARPKPAFPLEDCQREYGRITPSASPQRSRYTRPSSLPPSCRGSRCRDLDSLSEADQATGTVFTNGACAPSLASNGKTTCRTKRRAILPSIESIMPQVQLRWGWPRHKNRRRTRAQSRLLQRAPRKKARSWCSKRASQRSAEETACTGENQPSVMAARPQTKTAGAHQ